MYESVDMNKLYFQYVGPTKDVSFYKYMDSEKLFNELKDSRIIFNDALEKQKELMKKIKAVKIGGKNSEQEKAILKSFTNLERKFLIFLGIILKCSFLLVTKQNKMKLKEQDLKY